FEKAIAAALGDDIQASTDTSAPVYWGGSEAKAAKLPGQAIPLSTLTETPGELSARLSQCGLVDEADGPRLARELGPGQRLVSKSGYLWRWDGFVRTPDAPISASERLEQRAQLEAAEATLAPQQADLATAEASLEDTISAREEAETVLRSARANIPTASKALDEARRASATARQSAERTAMQRETALSSLARAEADLRAVSETLALAIPSTDDAEEARLADDLNDARTTLAEAREREIEMRGHLTDLTRGREQAAARRDGLKRDLEEWTRRASTAAERHSRLTERRTDAAKRLAAAKANASGAGESELRELRDRVDTLENGRKDASDVLVGAETRAREAESAARAATAAAAKAREALAASAVMIETVEARFTECADIARTQFQRLPEGLLPLATSLLSEEVIADATFADASQKADFLKRDRDQLGGVNMEAEAEAEALAERLGTQAIEKKDLTQAIAKLREGVEALNGEGRARLLEAFETVNEHFKALFTALFRGGQAELRLVDAEDPLAAGLEIFAQPPGKRLGTLRLMSGGEQALTAAALIFAVFLSNPAPVCVLDEVDAPLDDANVDRFCRMLDEMRKRTNTRFIVITHNPVTMSRMDRLFGVTMREKGVSKLVSVDLNAAEELVAAE
ncbi:MAG: chromosome segregation protein SMC, partial [Pseudomonadota bacterium]